MNFSSAFSFGGLIKTMLPGLIVLAAFVMIGDVLSQGVAYYLLAESPKEITIAIGLFSALFLGVNLNTIIFLGVNDIVIRARHQKRHPELYALEKAMTKNVVEIVCKRQVQIADKISRAEEYIQSDEIFQAWIGLPHYTELRDRYWFYMEFQMNSAVAIILLAAASSTWIVTYQPLVGNVQVFGVDITANACVALTLLLASIFWVCIMLSAASRNYDRHKRKIVSLGIAGLDAFARFHSPTVTNSSLSN